MYLIYYLFHIIYICHATRHALYNIVEYRNNNITFACNCTQKNEIEPMLAITLMRLSSTKQLHHPQDVTSEPPIAILYAIHNNITIHSTYAHRIKYDTSIQNTSSVILLNSTLADSSLYELYCMYTSHICKTMIGVTIAIAPTVIHTVPSVVYSPCEPIQITCHAINAKPAATVKLYMPHIYATEHISSKSTDNMIFNTSNSISIPAQKTYRDPVECVVSQSVYQETLHPTIVSRKYIRPHYAPEDSTINVHQKDDIIQLSCVSQSNPTPSYYWKILKQKGYIYDSSGANYNFTADLETGLYRCTAHNYLGQHDTYIYIYSLPSKCILEYYKLCSLLASIVLLFIVLLYLLRVQILSIYVTIQQSVHSYINYVIEYVAVPVK